MKELCARKYHPWSPGKSVPARKKLLCSPRSWPQGSPSHLALQKRRHDRNFLPGSKRFQEIHKPSEWTWNYAIQWKSSILPMRADQRRSPTSVGSNIRTANSWAAGSDIYGFGSSTATSLKSIPPKFDSNPLLNHSQLATKMVVLPSNDLIRSSSQIKLCSTSQLSVWRQKLMEWSCAFSI